jgi:hypothetical protein
VGAGKIQGFFTAFRMTLPVGVEALLEVNIPSKREFMWLYYAARL